VNSGLLKRATTGEAIAGVLAHEIAHVTQRHSMRRALRQVGVTSILALVFGGTELAIPVGMLSGLGTAKYDRDEESEADKLGLELLIAARIAPDKLADFLGGLKTDGVQLPTFLASHPDPGDRARALRALVPNGPATVALPAPPQAACR
jgi:beta-barrel assembly-enhancing protease